MYNSQLQNVYEFHMISPNTFKILGSNKKELPYLVPGRPPCLSAVVEDVGRPFCFSTICVVAATDTPLLTICFDDGRAGGW